MMYLNNYSQLLCDYKEIMRSDTAGSAHSGAARRRLDCYLWRRGDLVFMASGRADLHTKRPGWDLLLCTKIPVTHGCPGVQRLQRTLCGPGDRITLQDNLLRCETNTLLSRSSSVQGNKLVLFNSCDKQCADLQITKCTRFWLECGMFKITTNQIMSFGAHGSKDKGFEIE